MFTNQVAIARQKATEEVSAYLPQANVSATFDDNIKLQTTLIPAGAFGPEPTKITLGNPYASNVTGRVDQVLYDPALIAAMKANKPNIEVARLQKEQNDLDLIVNISKAYYQVLTLKEQEKLLLQNEKRYAEILQTLQMQYEKGVVKKVEYDRMKVNLANTSAQKTYTQTNILLATNRLKYAMGLNFQISVVLNDSISNTENTLMPQLENINVQNRIDYRIKQQNLLLQQVDLKRKRAALLPVLTAYAQYGVLGYGTSVSMMLEKSQQFDFAALGLKINVPLFSGLKKSSQIQQSKLTLSNTLENLMLYENEYALEIQNFNTQLLNSYTTLQTNKNNLDLAKDVFETTSFQYENSAATLSELLNSDYAHKEAQTNYLTSLLSFLTARIDLEKSNGTLKQYARQL